MYTSTGLADAKDDQLAALEIPQPASLRRIKKTFVFGRIWRPARIPVWRCEVTRNWKKPLKLSGVYDDHRRRDQQMGRHRNGWDKKKQDLISTPQSRKRPGSTRRRGARTPATRARPVEYHTFEMMWNKDNNPNHWLNQLKTQGAYNERCRCTLTGATKTEMTTILYIRFPRTETKAFRTVQEMKNSELDLWNITSTNELSAKQIPVHNHDDCFLFN